ncbi:MAG: sigma 54-interacting transcriptional regulator, partial [Bryobacteraceae bacterium]
GTTTIPIDVRLVAATNRNLPQMVADESFRSDLFYRLNVFPITIPPLRAHPEDIPALAQHFMRKYTREMNRQVETMPLKTMQALENWHWPGNVREMENFIERSVILSPGRELRAPLDELKVEPVDSPRGTLAEMERNYILRVLRDCRGIISASAIRLGLPRSTLSAMMHKLGISRKDL